MLALPVVSTAFQCEQVGSIWHHWWQSTWLLVYRVRIRVPVTPWSSWTQSGKGQGQGQMFKLVSSRWDKVWFLLRNGKEDIHFRVPKRDPHRSRPEHFPKDFQEVLLIFIYLWLTCQWLQWTLPRPRSDPSSPHLTASIVSLEVTLVGVAVPRPEAALFAGHALPMAIHLGGDAGFGGQVDAVQVCVLQVAHCRKKNTTLLVQFSAVEFLKVQWNLDFIESRFYWVPSATNSKMIWILLLISIL